MWTGSGFVFMESVPIIHDRWGVSPYDGLGTSQHLHGIRNIAFTRILLDQCLCIAGIRFAAGFRHLIRQARADYEWIGTPMMKKS